MTLLSKYIRINFEKRCKILLGQSKNVKSNEAPLKLQNATP